MRATAVLVGLGLCLGFADDTTTYMGGASRSGSSSEQMPPLAGATSVVQDWSVTLPAPILGTAIEADGLVFVNCTDGKVYALDRNTGMIVWSYATSAPIHATPAYYRGRVYVNSRDGKLYCLRAKTGTLLYSIAHNTDSVSSPAIANGRIYVGLGDARGTLAAYDALTGNPLPGWTSPPTNQITWSSPTCVGDKVLLPNNAGILSCFNADTGQLLWDTTSYFTTAGTVSVTNGSATVTGSGTSWTSTMVGALFQVDGDANVYTIASVASATSLTLTANYSGATASGAGYRISWRPGSGVYYSGVTVYGTKVLYSPGDGDRNLYIIDLSSGALIEKVSLKPGNYAKPNGSMEDTPDPVQTSPQSMVDPDTYQMLYGMDKATRDVMIDGFSHLSAEDKARLKDHFDTLDGTNPPVMSMPSGSPVWGAGNPARQGSPAVFNGKVVLTQREITGAATDKFFFTYLDLSATGSKWGPNPFEIESLPNPDLVPSAWISADNFAYVAMGASLYCYNLSSTPTPSQVGSAIVIGSGVTGSPHVANARLYLTTLDGRVIAYRALNNPPLPPTSFSPSGNQNITSTNQPTISWSGHTDPDGEPMAGQIQYAFGLTANVDLDGTVSTTASGISSYTLPSPVPNNTLVRYRVRVQDSRGAWSDWSAEQTFWVNRDVFPPDPVSWMDAVPGDGRVDVYFGASPSADVVWYKLYYKPSGTAWSSASLIDMIPATGSPVSVTGLTNFVAYDFMMVAVDAGLNDSPGVVDSATPTPPIFIGSTGYSTIQGAINAASPGDTVMLGSGTFFENVTLKPGVSLAGVSPRYTKLIGTTGSPVVHVSGAASSLQTQIYDLNISGGTGGIKVSAGDVYVHHVIVHDSASHGIEALAGTKLMVVNTTILNNAGSGIRSAAPETTVRNNICGNNTGVGIETVAGSQVTYNDSYSNAASNYSGPTGTGNLSSPASFTAASMVDQTYLEQSNSSSVDAGDPADPFFNEPSPNGGRINQGAYGNTVYAAKTPPAAVVTEAGGGGGGGGCYLATAALAGGPREVLYRTRIGEHSLSREADVTLRRLAAFRDDYVRTNAVGAAFAGAYSAEAPEAAAALSSSETMRGVVAAAVVRPASLVTALASGNGLVALLMLAFLASILAARRAGLRGTRDS